MREFKMTPDALIDLKTSGMYAAGAILNAYISGQPVNAANRKESWISQHIDDNGKLLPLTKVAAEKLLNDPEWVTHPLVTAAMALKPANKAEESADEKLLSAIQREILELSPRGDFLAGLWIAYYKRQPFLKTGIESVYPESIWAGFARSHTDAQRNLLPLTVKAMERIEANGKAPSREILGLEKVHTVVLTFPTAEAASAFLSKWRKDLGDGIAAMIDKLKLKVAGV